MIRFAESLRDASPDTIAFVDHAPSPADFLRALGEVWDTRPLPRVLVHAFGDFALHPEPWLGAESAIRKFRPTFIVASERQARLLESWIDAKVEWIPFPVDTQFFSPGPSDFLARCGIPAHAEIFTYTGRLSLQKNLLPLVRSFATYGAQIDPEARLLLAGPFDDMGVPYLGREMPAGLYENDLLSLIAGALPHEVAARVQYLGDLASERLRDLYRATDVFVSLSTHNDEDFGMSPAEALSTGCTSVLTDWGGYASFAHVRRRDGSPACEFLPVRIESTGIWPVASSAVKIFTRAAALAEGEERAAIAESARALFSIETVARKIHAVHGRPSPEFGGFTSRFRQVVATFRLNPKAPYSTATGYSPLYREVYATYLE